MKKVVIFGATGNTGLCSTEHAVKSGLQTRVFVRDEEKIPSELKDKVEIVVGDVTDAKKVSEAISGVDGVVVVLGTRNKLEPTTVMSDGMKNIVAGMKEHNVEPVSVCLSAFLFYEPEKVPAIFKAINEDHKRMLNVTKESGLKWIAVLPPRITESASSAFTVKFDVSPGGSISKYDLGSFLVKALSYPDHYQKVCGIAEIKPE